MSADEAGGERIQAFEAGGGGQPARRRQRLHCQANGESWAFSSTARPSLKAGGSAQVSRIPAAAAACRPYQQRSTNRTGRETVAHNPLSGFAPRYGDRVVS